MAAQAESRGSFLDTAKIVFAILLLVGGVIGFYYFSDQILLYRVLGVISVTLAAIAVLATTGIGRSFVGFLKEVRLEVRKVVWPTRQETVQATLVVVALVFVVGVALWLLDMLLFWAVSFVTGTRT